MKLTVENLTVMFKNRIILDNVSLQVEAGEIVAVVGPNGSGKSTLCTAIAGVSQNYGLSTVGRIRIGDKELSQLSIHERCALLGVIFQNSDNFLFSQYVEDELRFAPENLCVPRAEIETRIKEALDFTGISYLRHRKIQELSGGEKKLVSIASVLTMMSKFLIADEITSGVDEDRKVQIREILRKLAKDNIGILMISHNRNDIEIADRIYVLKDGKLHDRTD
ncbi:MAG TPA: ABC transporter ATP-binding protein [Clostridia bacterium]|jgi:energy-coupling factor transport system ATP-binding protein|nr:ABC transporter ATP-binding protein [Clostridiaceae bacterium]HPZ51519.1 ABC transporter ATP-binding protein [Clostridia bacterium]